MDPLHPAVERLVIRPLLDADAELLTGLRARARRRRRFGGAMSGLMLHLLLTQPKAADEPAPESDQLEDKWVGRRGRPASDRWARAWPARTPTTRARHSAGERGALLPAGRRGDRRSAGAQAAGGVARARRRCWAPTRAIRWPTCCATRSMPRDIRLIDIVGGAVTVFQTRRRPQGGPSVPGAFTPAGWEIVKGRIERLTADRGPRRERLGAGGAAASAQGVDADALQAAYFRRYVDAWKAFLLSLSVKEPTNIDEVRSLLKAFVMDRPLDADLAQRQQGSDLQGRVAARKAAEGKGAARRQKLGDAQEEASATATDGDGAETARAAARAASRSDEPTSPEDVGREFAAVPELRPDQADRPRDLRADPGRAAGRRRRVGRARSARVPGHGQDPAGEAVRT